MPISTLYSCSSQSILEGCVRITVGKNNLFYWKKNSWPGTFSEKLSLTFKNQNFKIMWLNLGWSLFLSYLYIDGKEMNKLIIIRRYSV